MMSKYKIREVIEGFRVWELKDMGQGYGWEQVDRRFQTREEAERYIEDRKRGDKDEGIS